MRIGAELDRLGLAAAVAELDTYGLTVVPPERVDVPVAAMLERVLDLMEARNGERPDLTTGSTHTNVCFPTLYYFLFDDPIFEQWLMHPVHRALVDYLLGEQCILHATTVFMKGPTEPPVPTLQLGLHSDQQMVPDPFPPYALIAGATLLLTDYTREGGAFAFVPGSHRAGRHPVGHEAEDRAVAVEAPAGSLLVHHGALWHGSFGADDPGPARRDGVRLLADVRHAARRVPRARDEGGARSQPATVRTATRAGSADRLDRRRARPRQGGPVGGAHTMGLM